MSGSSNAARRPPQLAPLIGMLLRTTATRGRVGAALAATLLVWSLGASLGRATLPARAVEDLIAGPVLGLLVPLVALVAGSAVLGDPADDGTLVYLWLRPVPRTTLAAAAWSAAVVVVLPVAVAAAAGVGLLAGRTDLIGGAVVAASAAALVYTALAVPLGLLTRHPMAWGGGTIVLWEGVASNLSPELATLSVRRYVGTLYTAIAHPAPTRFPSSTPVAVVVLAGMTVAGVLLAAWLLRTRDVR